ncbi:MAG: HupE/UreJ family protein [Gammaproteobacteria bacterium]|nr:HupE/UreJ family protein [Gammaproteobacteria bacterium]MDH5345250.1 HupE/UreJ family protein [Gammaproteobacteria bacterium]
MRIPVLLAIAAIAVAGPAVADVFQPAYLELREADDGLFDVLWKVPSPDPDRRLSAYVVFPEGTEQLTEPRVIVVDGAWIERYQVRRAGGFVGETIAIEGNAVGVTDVIARIERRDGSSQVARLAPEQPRFVVEPPQTRGQIAWSYTVLGVEHILGGIDHLLFVMALLLVVRGSLRIIATITAFTVAHSLTLVLATLGVLNVPGPPVEAIIALSIVFVAAEVIHGIRGRPGITARAPWVVAFSFGLLHGLGFAGALAEVGLPQIAIPMALLMFNVGVEIGQLLFVGAVLVTRTVLGYLPVRAPAWGTAAAAYGIGSIAAFWTIERVFSFWT